MPQTLREFTAEMLVFLNGLAFLLGLEGNAPWHGLGMLCIALNYWYVFAYAPAHSEDKEKVT